MAEKIITPWSSVGYLTYKRTYSRRLNETDPNSPTEEFSDTIDRVINATQTQLKCGFDKAEIKRLRNYFLTLKGTVAGRFLWQLGTPTVERLGLSSLQNCAFTVVDKPVEPFTWAMDLLMLGCFKEGTLVQTETGPKKIEELTGSDKILTFDESTKEFVLVKPDWVSKTDSSKKPKVKITLPDNSEIICTADHKFLTENGWVEAQYLTPDDNIVTA